MVAFLCCGGGCMWWWLYTCGGLAVHGGFVAVTQAKNVPRDSLLCCTMLCAMLCTCARIRLLSPAPPGVSENVTDDTLAWHFLEYL